MATPPARTELADTYPNPSNAVFRTGIGKLHDFLIGLLGSTGNAAEARNALGIGPAISNRNLLINANGAINQRGYVSGTATGAANAYTLDRWRVVTSGQSVAFGAASPDRTMTAPAGGLEQVIEGVNVIGGVYTLSWTGTATATVNGAAITNGGNTSSLPANTNVTIRFSSGTVLLPQFELGTVATPFERRPYDLELLRCFRYTQYITGGGGGVCRAGGGEFTQFFHARMRVAPTYANGGNGTLLDGLGGAAISSAFLETASADSARIAVVVAGAVAGRGANIVDQTSAFYAEL